MTSYVALLRGINVGGNNLIKMADLKACFEENGYSNVSTYIQSGNVLFRSAKPARALTVEIEKLLSKQFGYQATVVVLSKSDLKRVITKAPRGFGKQPQKYHSDALFLMPPLTASQAMNHIEQRPGVDRAWPGKGLLYFARLTSQRTKSKLSAIAMTPIYKRLTIRSWGTVTKLLQKLEDLGS